MFTAYLFVMKQNWQQPKYTLTDEWIDKLVSLQGNNSGQKRQTVNTPNSAFGIKLLQISKKKRHML